MVLLRGLLRDEAKSRAEQTVERITTAVAGPIDTGAVKVSVAASVGISIYPGDGNSPDALIRSAEQRRRSADKNKTQHLLDSLTPREFEVMQLVITGMLNKQIAGELGTAEKTVKVHRGRMMQKLGVTSVAELVRLVEKAGVAPAARHETKVSYSFGERLV